MMKSSAFILLIGVSLLLPQSCRDKRVSSKEPVKVTVKTISFSQEDRQQVFLGTIDAGKTSIISASYPGRLVSLDVSKGRRVSRGSAIAVIDSPAAKSLYESSKATFEQARDALERVSQVYSSGSVTELKYVEVQTSYSKAEAAFSAAKRALDDCTVKAPYDGVIGDVFLQEGVDVSAAEPICRLLDVQTLVAHASVPENEYSSFDVGQEALIKVDAVESSIYAKLTDKGFEASPLSHSYDFTFKINGNTANMMPGMVCKVYMKSSASSSDGKLVIPSSSVKVDADGRYVWCISEDGKVEKKHIVVDGFSGDGVVVCEGLSEGDRLVIEGSSKISTGMTNISVDECQ